MVKFSDDVTQGVEKSAARAMLRAVGLEDEDFNKFQVGIVSAGNEVTPCNLTGPELSIHAKEGVNGTDSAGLIFSTIAVSDGISMGHEGFTSFKRGYCRFCRAGYACRKIRWNGDNCRMR